MGMQEIIFDKSVTLDEAKNFLDENSSTESLELKSCDNITTEDFKTLIDSINTELRTLTVHHYKHFNDELVGLLIEQCKNLHHVLLSGSFKDIRKTGISTITTKCHELKHLSIFCIESEEDDDECEWVLDDELFDTIMESKTLQLQHFGLGGFKNISSGGLHKFIKFISTTLTSLDLSELPAVTDALLNKIGNDCPQLQSLHCKHCEVSNKGIMDFCSKCTLLQSVDLCGCNELTNEAISSLAINCPRLKVINLGWCLKLTETCLEVLALNCPNLECVDLRHCSIQHIPHSFVKLASLKELQVEGCSALKCPPLDVALKGVNETKTFLDESNLHCMCRVAFIGEEGSGKSSLAMCMVSSSLAVADISTEGVQVIKWRPFGNGLENSVDKETLEVEISKEWDDLTIEVWDCGGRKCIQGLHPLFLTDQTLYVLTFNVGNPRDIDNMPNWLFLVQTKTPGCAIVVVGTHADGTSADFTNLTNKALDTLKSAENEHYLEVKAELEILRTDDKQNDPFIQTRIEKLEKLLNCRPRLPDKVLYVSSIKGKGITELQNEIFTLLQDPSLFPHLVEEVDISVTYLYSEILKLRGDKVVVIPWEQYIKMASESGINNQQSIEKATMVLECRGCITVFRIPAKSQEPCDTRMVCVHPSILLDCLACMHNETEPREFVPRFIKAGHLDKYWPTNTKPNDWTLRSAIDDIVSKGLVREAVVPLCFQAIHLEEQEILKILHFCRDIGVLVEGAPKGSYEVELVLAYYKNLSVVKRYFLPLQRLLPPESKAPNIWPAAVPEGYIQVGWRFKFPDEVSSKCSTLIIGACRNYKMDSEIHCYCQRCLVLKVGEVMAKISRDGSYLDMIGRCRITNGSKQTLNMTWYILAQFFYVTDMLLQNYSGLSPEIMVPLYGCSRPKHKSLFELVKEYNVDPSNLANFRWFLPPGGLDVETHTQIPSNTSQWLATIARKSTLFISYHSDHQDEVKLLRMSLSHSGFNCVGEWTLLGHGQKQTERRRQSIMGSSLLLAFVTPDFLKWSRALQDINLTLELNKPVIALFFDKNHWPADNDVVELLTDKAVCLDFDAGSGEALSHQYDQQQFNNLVSQCNDILYGTGDIHPPEPPVSPDNTFHEQHEGSLQQQGNISAQPITNKHDTVNLNHKPAAIVEPDEEPEKRVQRMAASAVAAAVAGATAQHIAKADNKPEAAKAAAAAAEVAKAVVDGNSDAAAKAVTQVAKIVEDSLNQAQSKHVSNGSISTPPKSATCSIL